MILVYCPMQGNLESVGVASKALQVQGLVKDEADRNGSKAIASDRSLQVSL